MAAVVVLLMAIGAVFVFSAGADLGSELSLHKFYNYAGLRQILFFPLACVMLFSAAAFDYRKLRLGNGWLKWPGMYLLILGIMLLILVLIRRARIMARSGAAAVGHSWVCVRSYPLAGSPGADLGLDMAGEIRQHRRLSGQPIAHRLGLRRNVRQGIR